MVRRLPQLEERANTSLSKKDLSQVENLKDLVAKSEVRNYNVLLPLPHISQANLRNAQKDAEAIKQEITNIEQKITNAGGQELAKQKAKGTRSFRPAVTPLINQQSRK